MPTFETHELQICHTCRMFLANGDLPEDFPEFHADVDEIDPDDVDWHPAHIHSGDGHTGGNWPSALGWSLSVEDGDSDEHSVYPCGACGESRHGKRWPCTAMRPVMVVEVHYSDDCWDEDGELVKPWYGDGEKAFEANPRSFSQSVTLICRDGARAEDDQTVMGSSWEVSEGFAYTVVSEFEADGVCKALREEGYEVREDPNTGALHS